MRLTGQTASIHTLLGELPASEGDPVPKTKVGGADWMTQQLSVVIALVEDLGLGLSI